MTKRCAHKNISEKAVICRYYEAGYPCFTCEPYRRCTDPKTMDMCDDCHVIVSKSPALYHKEFKEWLNKPKGK